MNKRGKEVECIFESAIDSIVFVDGFMGLTISKPKKLQIPISGMRVISQNVCVYHLYRLLASSIGPLHEFFYLWLAVQLAALQLYWLRHRRLDRVCGRLCERVSLDKNGISDKLGN